MVCEGEVGVVWEEWIGFIGGLEFVNCVCDFLCSLISVLLFDVLILFLFLIEIIWGEVWDLELLEGCFDGDEELGRVMYD